MDKDSNRVELRGGGWPGVIGYCNDIDVMTSMRQYSGVMFETVKSSAFFFEHAASILVVQGMILQDFFPPDVCFKIPGTLRGTDIARGPFLLLKGELSMPGDPPMRLKNMVLAHVTQAPEDMSREELLGVLLRAIS